MIERRSRVDDDERLDLERGRDLEDRPERRALAADAVDLGIREAHAREPVRRADEEDLLDVVGRLGLDDDALRAVRRAGVAVDEDGAQVREVLDEAGLGGAHDVADRGGVLEARDADHDVGATEAGDLVPDGRRQSSGHFETVPRLSRLDDAGRVGRCAPRSRASEPARSSARDRLASLAHSRRSQTGRDRRLVSGRARPRRSSPGCVGRAGSASSRPCTTSG